MIQRVTTKSASTDSSNQLSKKQARKRLIKALKQGFNEDDPVLIEALPSLGKSRNTVKWSAKTGNPLTVFTARHKLYEQYANWCQDDGLQFKILPSLQEDCETANGEEGKEWKERVNNEYNQSGLHPKELHRQAKELFGERLPCQQHGNCSYFSAKDFDPDEFDVLIGHYKQAYVPDYTEGRYVAIDEFPKNDYWTTYNGGRVTTAIQAYLDHHDSFPFDSVKGLKEYRRNPEKKENGIEWFDRHGLSRDITGVVEDKSGNAHSEAGMMTYALLVAKDLENQWEYAELPDGRIAVRSPKNESLTILNPPALDEAESVVALDGTPTVEKWKLILGNDLSHIPIFNDEEKRDFLRNELNIQVVQTSEDAKPYSSGRYVTPEKDLVLFEAVRRRENNQPALITALKAEKQYEEHGLSKIVKRTEHYGNFIGMNDFKKERTGIVAGSPHYGDPYIEMWAALAGESTSREGYGMETDFGEFGNQILHGMRENDVLQAVMRFGRDSRGATVYVHTAALPEWVEREKPISKIHPWSEGMKEALDTIKELDKAEWRTKEIAERVSVSANQVRDHLKTLESYNYVNCQNEGRGFTWSDQALDDIGEYGHVEF